MGGQGSDFIVRPPDAGLGVRRVEREAEAHDLGRRDSQGRKGSAKHQPQAETSQEQEVAVDVSEEYLAEHEPPTAEDAAAADSVGEGGTRRLDIEA